MFTLTGSHIKGKLALARRIQYGEEKIQNPEGVPVDSRTFQITEHWSIICKGTTLTRTLSSYRE
jgi:hypothetical protein